MEQLAVPSLLNDSKISLEIKGSQQLNSRFICPSKDNTEWIPTYHTLVEANLSINIQKQILPYITEIKDFKPHCSRINNYKIGSTIGSGQFGKVFKCLDERSSKQRIVAIKRINKQKPKYSMNQIMRQMAYWKQFNVNTDDISTNNIGILMNLNRCRWEMYLMKRTTGENGGSPYIVKVFECLDSPTSHDIWIISDWCNLGELRWKRDDPSKLIPQWEMIIGKNKTVADFAIKAASDLSNGLKFLRDISCIHRDVKPSNIMVDSRSKLLKISDFGCSIFLPEVLPFKFDKDPGLEVKQKDLVQKCFINELNKIVGTPAFIPPELCKFEFKLDTNVSGSAFHVNHVNDGFKIDIWSLGVTLYCLLFNELPFSGDNEFDTYNKINKVSLSDKINSNWLNDMIITDMLDKNPSTRKSIKYLQKSIKPHFKESNFSQKTNGVGQNSLKSFWKRLRKSKGDEGILEENADDLNFDEGDISRLTTNSSLSFSFSSSYEEPVNITHFIDSINPKVNLEDIEDDKVMVEHLKKTDSSPLSFGILTPIKNMIRINNTPDKDEIPQHKQHCEKPIKVKINHNDVTSSQPNMKIRSSRNIINFKKYIAPEHNESTETIEQIKDYLNYNGDYQ